MIEVSCSYCKKPAMITHILFSASCLCDECNNREDLTYYHHKWMPMAEAEKLENNK